MSKAAKWAALPVRERWMVAFALIALWRAWFGLRTTSFARLRARANGPAIAADTADGPSAERIAWAVAAASRLVPDGSNCLIRALAAGRMLRHYGYATALQIGVTKAPDGRLAAHAWLESGGRVIIGDFALDRYVPLGTSRSAA